MKSEKFMIFILFGIFIYSLYLISFIGDTKTYTKYDYEHRKLKFVKNIKRIFGGMKTPKAEYEELRLRLSGNIESIEDKGNIVINAKTDSLIKVATVALKKHRIFTFLDRN